MRTGDELKDDVTNSVITVGARGIFSRKGKRRGWTKSSGGLGDTPPGAELTTYFENNIQNIGSCSDVRRHAV